MNAARLLGALGGKKSAESRLGGKTKEERSEAMRKVSIARSIARENEMEDYTMDTAIATVNALLKEKGIKV